MDVADKLSKKRNNLLLPELFVKFADTIGGGGPSVAARKTDLIKDLLNRYSKNIPLGRLSFRYNGKGIPVDSVETIQQLGICHEDTIDVTIKGNGGASKALEENEGSTSQEHCSSLRCPENEEAQSITIKFVQEGSTGMKIATNFETCRITLLRRVLVSFAKGLNTPVDWFQFTHNGKVIRTCDGKTPEEYGIEKDCETIFWKQTQFASCGAAPQEVIFVVFKDNLQEPEGYPVRLDCEIFNLFKNYSLMRKLPQMYFWFAHDGKMIPSNCRDTVGQLGIKDCDQIHVGVNRGETVIIFKDANGLEDMVSAPLNGRVVDVLQKYSDSKETSIGDHQFTHNGKCIPSGPFDTIKKVGIKHRDIIQVTSMKYIHVKIKDEKGSIHAFHVKSDAQISNVMTKFSELNSIPLKKLWFTNRGTKIPISSQDTVSALRIKDDDTIHVAQKTLGINLTRNCVQNMYDMNGSMDNPSFKPNVQVIDLLRPEHRNHWKFIMSDGTHTFHGECAPQLNGLFSNMIPGAIIRVNGFRIKDGMWRKKICYLFSAEKIATQDGINPSRQLKDIEPKVQNHPRMFCHQCKRINGEAGWCSRCNFECYCSKDCQKHAWSCHKHSCSFYKAYISFAKREKRDMTTEKIIGFWLEKMQRPVKPFRRDDAAQLVNTLLYISFLNRQEMGNSMMLKAHILNAAFLRQSCATSIKDINDLFRRTSSEDNFLKSTPYYKAAVEATSTATTIYQSKLIGQYLEQNHASDSSIIDSTILEGEVMVEFVCQDKDQETYYAELSSDLVMLLTKYSVERGVSLKLLKFSFDGISLSSNREILPVEHLSMKSRGKYTINVSILKARERRAQECIFRFVYHCHRQRRIRMILARNLIADTLWRYNERKKAGEAIAAFIWHYHRERKCRKTISNLIWSKVALQRRSRLRKSVIMIQRISRGNSARRLYLGQLEPRLEEVRNFYDVWKKPIKQVPASVQTLTDWALVREQLDLKRVELLDEVGNLADTDEKLSQAITGAMKEEAYAELAENGEINSSYDNSTATAIVADVEQNPIQIDWSQFQVTAHVVKFMRNGDARYREIFVKRMKQLAKGERSHKLQKPLKGCKSVIYESYLENSGGGYRILWTQESDTIVVWFIAKHKSVSRLAKLIDDAKNRTARQQIPQTVVDKLDGDRTEGIAVKREVLLDALGNVPLKLYDINFDNIDDISSTSWTPQMHLTDEERKVVEAKGTVLLLGRSGTGKTVVICNRIEFDRQRLGHKRNFSQLFVSRSGRLCRYVEGAVGGNKCSSFNTFNTLAHRLESSLQMQQFHSHQYVNYQRFKRDFYIKCCPQDKASALLAWKAIRTFLKGSIEAFQSSTRLLSKEHFVSEKLGKNRCKIPSNMRCSLYDILLQYQQWLKEQRLWDDCDRIMTLLVKIQNAKKHDPSGFEKIKWSKIYVDEVQDYTQIEILLFFYISAGPGSLFLAGDPAQSVVEGNDFRFEEVRSVGYFVAGNKRRHLIPEKPKIVNVNFRSHAGILNCAGAFLDILFDYFPGSAKQLKKDFGLFKGARPGVFQNVQVTQLSALLKDSLQGTVVLTHDESASHWRAALGHPLVYGIREAKGLEFKSVVIVDFFAEIEQSLQKPWRNLLLNREGSDFGLRYPLVENHLKLLYTAITRCIEQLFFAETSPSIAGNTAVRWLTTTKPTSAATANGNLFNDDTIATSNNVSDLESMMMTNDEFCIVGIDNAELAVSPDVEIELELAYLDRAIYCFEKGQNINLLAKAKAHLLSIQFRHKHLHLKSFPKKDLDRIEREVAFLTQSLLIENLLVECLKLLHFITPFLSQYTQEKLEEKIVIKIQDVVNV